VPDPVVIGMIKNMLKDNPTAKGFIFDGFPRTVSQAEALDALLSSNDTPVSGMLSLEVEKEELITRLKKRAVTSGRLDDQDLAVIENRINVYDEKTAPLKEYYAAQNKYFRYKRGGID
jgi:adenylate kinase